MGSGVSLQTGTTALSQQKRGMNLTVSGGVGYAQLPVLYSNPGAVATGTINFNTPVGEKTRFYQQVTVSGGEEAVQGRYDAGFSIETPSGVEYNVGAYASNDFKAPEFVTVSDPENLTLASKSPIRSGLLQAGVTAGVKYPVSKNVDLFARADVANLSYSHTGECVHPVKSKSDDYINNVHSCVLNDNYRYEKGVKSAIGVGVEAGATAKFGNLSITGKGGYNNFQGANFGVGVSYGLNIFKNK